MLVAAIVASVVAILVYSVIGVIFQKMPNKVKQYFSIIISSLTLYKYADQPNTAVQYSEA